MPYAQNFDIMGDEIFDTDEVDNDANMRDQKIVNVKGSTTKCRLSKVAWMKMHKYLVYFTAVLEYSLNLPW